MQKDDQEKNSRMLYWSKVAGQFVAKIVGKIRTGVKDQVRLNLQSKESFHVM